MEEKTQKTLIKIGLKFLSVFFVIVFVVSCLGAAAITGVRNFFQSSEFETMVNDIDLNEVKFTANGKTYNASDFVYDAVIQMMPSAVKGQTSIFGNIVNSAVKDIISSEMVDKAVKEVIMECVDYYLESDSKEASKRLKENKTVVNSSENYENVTSPEEAVKVYVRPFIIRTVENSTGLNSDQIIVLLSKQTREKCLAVAMISAILLIVCNFGSVFDVLLYFGGGSVLFGLVIKVLQSKFENSQEDKTLIGYQMLKPLVDSFSSNAAVAIVVGVVLILGFIGLFVMYRSKEVKATEK